MGVYYFDNPAQERDLYEEIYNRQIKYKRTRDSVTAMDAARASSISKLYPNFSPDVISAMTLLKVKPESEVLAEVSQRIQEHNQRSILAKVGSGFKAGIRLGLLGLEDAYRSWVDRPINSFIASTFGDQKESLTFQDAYAQSGKSTVRNAINQLRSGQRVNLGQGFLPNSDLFDPNNPNSKFFEEYQYMVKKGMSPDKATQHINNYLGDPITEVDRRMQEESGMFTLKNRISGESTPISLGRSVANLVMEEGSRGYNTMSGIIDAGKIMFLDPANYFGLTARHLTKSRRMLKPSPELLADLKKVGIQGKKGSAEFTQSQKKAMGIYETGKFSFANKRQVNNYLEQDTGGQELIRWLATNDDTNRFIQLTGITDAEVLDDFKKIQISRRPEENKIKAIRKLLNDKYLGNPFSKPEGFGQKRPTVGAFGRMTGGLAENLLGDRLTPGLEGAGRLFGARKVIRNSLMENSQMGRIMASYASDLPYRFLDVDQIDQSIHQMKLWMDQTTMSSKDKSEVFDQVISLDKGDEAGLFDIAKDMMARTGEDLVENAGVKQADVRNVTTMFDEELEDYRKYWIDAVTGENVMGTHNFVPSIVEGKPSAAPGPQLLTEFINRTIPLPDARGLTKAYNSMGMIRALAPDLFKVNELGEPIGKLAKRGFDKRSLKGVERKIADVYMSEIWKPLVLLRGAWTIRVVGEEQLRMYARGFDNIFSQPFSWFSQFIMGTDDAAKVRRWNSKSVTYNDLFGDPFEDAREAQQASSRIAAINNNDKFFGGERKGVKKPGPFKFKVLKKQDIIRKSSANRRTKEYNEYLRNYFREIAKLHGDDLFKFLYRSDGGALLTPKQQQARLQEWMLGESDKVKAIIKLYNKGGPSFRRSAGTVGGRYSFAKALEARAIQAGGGTFSEKRELLEQLVSINRIEDIDLVQMNPFTISKKLKGDDDLITMIKAGEINGIKFDDVFKELDSQGTNVFKKKPGIKKKDSQFEAVVDIIDDKYESLPQYLAAPMDSYMDSPTGIWGWYTRQTARGFDIFMGSRTDNLSRSPVFRQLYWRQIYDMLPYMSAGMRARLLNGGTIMSEGIPISIKGARRANIPQQNLWQRFFSSVDPTEGGTAGLKLRKRDNAINFDMFEKEVKRLDDIDAKAGNVDVDFQKDIRKLEKEFRGTRREFNNELEEFQGNRYYIGKGERYTKGIATDIDLDKDLIIRKGDNVNKIAPSRKIRYDKKIQELRDKEEKLIGNVRKYDRVNSQDSNIYGHKYVEKVTNYIFHGHGNKLPGVPKNITQLRITIRNLNTELDKWRSALDDQFVRSGPESVSEVSILREIEVTSDIDWGLVEAATLNDYNTIKVTSDEWDDLWDNYIDDIKSYYYPDDIKEELELIKRLGGKRKIKAAWRKLNKEWTDNKEAIAKKLGDEAIDEDVRKLSNASKRIEKLENVLKKHEDELEKVKGRIDKVRVDVNDRLEKMELNINDKFNKKKESYIAERNKLYKAAGFMNDATSFNQIDTVAKAFALQGVEELLYDLSKNNKFFYNMRAIFPFGNAYKEIITTWAKLIAENPQIIRKGQVAVNALRKDNPFSPVEGEGFLGTDEITGEEVFYYPAVSDLASNILLGKDRNVGIRLPGYASSVNLALNVIPGVGPMVAIPFSIFLGGNPTFDNFKKVVFPYGLPDVQDAGDLIRAAGIPAWARNAWRTIAGFDEETPTNEITRVAGNTQIDVFRLLKANGELDDTPEQQAALMEKAKGIARSLTLIKTFSQFIGPTGLNARYDVGNAKNNGTVWAMQSLSDRYREILETPPTIPGSNQLAFAPGDNFGATRWFIEEFGFNPIDLAQPKSVVVEPRPVDEKGSEFERNNKDLFKDYPYTAQFAIPKGGGGPFNYEAYINTIVNETREPLKPSEWLQKRNQSLGQFYMENKRLQSLELFDINDPLQNKKRNRFLALQQLDARERFPGFDQTIVGLPATINVELQIKELEKWADEPKLANTKVGKDVATILQLFELFETKGYSEGLSKDGWKTSRKFIKERKFIRDRIAQLVMNNDDFYFIAQRVLLPYIEERKDFVEDIIYDEEVFKEYGMYLPNNMEF